MFKKQIYLFCLSFILIFSFSTRHVFACSYEILPCIILSDYELTLDIGDEELITAVYSTGKYPTWKSSDSKIASVNTYGLITAKKPGTVKITAKIKNAEASCKVRVSKTSISISQSSHSMERGKALQLTAKVSTTNPVKWKSNRKSIATVDENGVVKSIKPGEATITASCDGSTASCNITVKKPTIKLNKSELKLYRGQTSLLTATVSSNISPVFKTNRKSVATVNEHGQITAVKHGSAIITATVDGVSKTCAVIVNSPTITLNTYEINLKVGSTSTLKATVSSSQSPTFTTSNSNVVEVLSDGTIKAIKKGRAYVYAAEDGTKVKCVVKVA